jgi:hypothetical protein
MAVSIEAICNSVQEIDAIIYIHYLSVHNEMTEPPGQPALLKTKQALFLVALTYY